MSTVVSIYALFDPREPDVVRYVGKTVQTLKQRLNDHISESRVEKFKKCTWLNSVIKQGFEPQVKLIEEVTNDNWEEREIHWITHYRCLHGDRLTNTSFGGEGGNHTEEIKAKIVKSHLGIRPSQETRKKLSFTKKGKKLNLEHRTKVGDSLRSMTNIDIVIAYSMRDANFTYDEIYKATGFKQNCVGKTLKNKRFCSFMEIYDAEAMFLKGNGRSDKNNLQGLFKKKNPQKSANGWSLVKEIPVIYG